MNIETQRELLRQFFSLRSAHTTTMAPAPYRQRTSVYTDAERLADEERNPDDVEAWAKAKDDILREL